MIDQPAQAAPAGQRLLVLVADDDPGCRHLVAAVLEQMGLATRLAPDGAAAIQLAAEHAAELCCVILDVRMPVLDGIAAAEAIRGLAPGLMIIMMSAAFPRHYRERLASLGITQILDKPFPLSQLRALVRPLLEAWPPSRGGGSVDPAPGRA